MNTVFFKFSVNFLSIFAILNIWFLAWHHFEWIFLSIDFGVEIFIGTALACYQTLTLILVYSGLISVLCFHSILLFVMTLKNFLKFLFHTNTLYDLFPCVLMLRWQTLVDHSKACDTEIGVLPIPGVSYIGCIQTPE